MTSEMTLVLGDRPLNLADIEALLHQRPILSLSASAGVRMAESRGIVQRLAAADAPVYGINTGLAGWLSTASRPMPCTRCNAT